MNHAPSQDFSTLTKLKSQQIQDYKATVLIRCFNEIDSIPRFYASLAAQSFFDSLEIVFLDSGSTDGTLEFLLTKDINLYSISSHEFSFSKTCNLLLSLSSTEHNFFFSAHVYLRNKEMLEDVLATQRQTYPAIYFKQVVNKHTGYNTYEKAFLNKAFPDRTRIFNSNTRGKLYFSNAASYISKTFWKDHPFPEVAASEDKLWANATLSLGHQILYLETHPVEHSHNESPAQIEKRVRLNKISQYGTHPKPIAAVVKFLGVFLAMTLVGANIKEAYSYAYSHAKAYM